MVTLNLERQVFPQQHEFLTTTEPFVFFCGGRGSGKTRAGAEKTMHYLLEHPGSLGIITAPTYKVLRDATWRTCLEMWPKELIPKDGINLTDMRIKLGNSEVLFRSTEDAEHLRGPSIGFFWMDEGAESGEDAFQILQGCLRQEGRPHYGWVTSTPKGHNWLYQYFMLGKPGYRIILCSSRDNPFLPPDFVKSLEDSYRDDFALQEIEGQFVVVGGQCVFDLSILKAMLLECRPPSEQAEGLKVWVKPIVGTDYVIGADVGMTHDPSAAMVLNRRTGEVVATLHGKFLLDEFAFRLDKLGRQYHDALLVVEANAIGEAVLMKLKELGYPRIYQTKVKPLSFKAGETREPNYRYGWVTTANSKLLMVTDLEEAVRKREMVIYDKGILDEMFLFARNLKGQFMASQGGTDDRVMALGMAWQGRGYGGAGSFKSSSYLKWN